MTVVPMKEGNMTIKGYRYRLSGGGAWFYQDFAAADDAGKYEVEVTNNMPSVKVSLMSFPSSLEVGQLAPFTLELENVGSAPAEIIRVKTSRPWVYFPPAGQGWSNSSDAATQAIKSAVPNSCSPSGTLHSLPSPLAPGASAAHKAWLCPPSSGAFDFSFTVRFEKDGKLRTTTLTRKVNVNPGFAVKAAVNPGFKSGGEYLLSCNIDGGRGGRVEDIIVVGRGYEVKGVFNEEVRRTKGGLLLSTLPFLTSVDARSLIAEEGRL